MVTCPAFRTENDVYVAAGLAERVGRAYLRLERLEEVEPPIASAVSEYERMHAKPSLARALDLHAELLERTARTDETGAARARARALRGGFRSHGPIPVASPAG